MRTARHKTFEPNQPGLLRSLGLDGAHLLGFVLASSFVGDLAVRAAEDGVEDTGLHGDAYRIGWIGAEPGAAIELLCLPGAQPLGDLFGEGLWIGRCPERDRREKTSELVMTVTVRRCAAEARIDDQRTEHADDTHHVVEHVTLVPLARRLLTTLREAVIDRAREELFAAVEPPRLQQFLRSNDAQRLEQLGPDDVLAAFAAVQREIRDPCMIATRRAREESRVLVIGMRSGVQRACRGLEPLQQVAQA